MDGRYDRGEQLRCSSSHWVQRAQRRSDGRRVVLKSLATEYQSASQRAGLEAEYALTSSLRGPGLAEAIEFTELDGTTTLVLADAGERDLTSLFTGPRVSLAGGLEIATALADALARLHAQDVLHRDVTPGNVVLDAEGRVTLIDLEHSAAIPRAAAILRPPEHVTGTLDYLPPEQSGRTSHAVDHRSDLYGLGATVYAVFAQRPPFVTASALETLHAHLARRPAPLSSLREDIPAALDTLIARLLEKDPSARYQSAEAVARDLRNISAGEPLSEDEAALARAGRLAIPTRIYGREVETALIAEAVAAASATGRVGLLTIAGAAGIGKSGLLSTLHVPVLEARGWFGAGKYEQLDRGRPYAALSQAIGQIVEQIAALPVEALGEWRHRLDAALGAEGGSAAEVVPQLAALVRLSTPGPERPAAEDAEGRLFEVIRALLGALASGGGPLVLVLDDLQWADPPSARLLAHLAEHLEGPVVLVLAYRPSALEPQRPSAVALERLAASPAARTSIELNALGLEAVERLAVDTLDAWVGPAVAQVVHTKAGGNPFFVRQLLQEFHRQGVLRPGKEGWTFDEAEARAAPVTAGVAELLLARVEALPEATREALGAGACLGSRFSEEDLRIAGADPAALRPALEAELLIALSPSREAPAEGRFAFSHDRIEEVAYAALDAAAQTACHERLGVHRLAALSGDHDTDPALFACVSQLRRGAAPEALDEASRLKRARLHLSAGQRAHASAAYELSADLLEAAVAMLPEGAWAQRPALALAIHLEAAEVDFDAGRRARADATLSAALESAPDAADRAELYGLRARHRTVTGAFGEAIEAARAGLAPFGIDLPEGEAAGARVQEEVARIYTLLGEGGVVGLGGLPELREPGGLACMRLMTETAVATSFYDQNVFSYLLARATHYSIEHGHSRYAPAAYAFVGVILAAVAQDPEGGHAFGELAEAVAERFGDPVQRCRATHLFTHHVRHWRSPLSEHPDRFRAAFRLGVDHGDLQFAAYASCGHTMAVWPLGLELSEVEAVAIRGLEFCEAVANEAMVPMHEAYRQAARCLRRTSPTADSFEGPGFEEGPYLERIAGNGSSRLIYHGLRMQVAWLLRDPVEARRHAEIAVPLLDAAFGSIPAATIRFYAALLEASTGPAAEARARMTPFVEQLGEWAAGCPVNFAHQYALLRAEAARLAGDGSAALAAYDEAIRLARANGFVHEQALANELAARFHLAADRSAMAMLHLASALSGYALWGAQAKVAQLRLEHPALRLRTPTGVLPSLSASSSGSRTHVEGAIEGEGLLRATAAVASSQHIDAVITELLRVVAQAAGAERGHVLLVREGVLRVRASLDPGDVTHILDSAPAEAGLPLALLSRARMQHDPLVVFDARNDPALASDPVCQRADLRSLLCLPLWRRGRLLALVYLENNLLPGAFRPERVADLRLISAHLGIAIENAAAISAEREENRRRREVEHHLAQHAEALTRSNRELEGVLFAATHHLRQPAHSIRGLAEILAEELGAEVSPDVAELLQRIHTSGGRMYDLLAGIVRYADVQSTDLELEAVEVAAALEQARGELAEPLRAAAAEVLVRGPLPIVEAAPGTVAAVFMELLGNAVKFHDGPGARIVIEASTLGAEVRIAVSDDGPGVSEEWLERAFEPLRQIDPTHPQGGTGIGLAVARRRLRASGGRMGMEAAPGGGTTVWFTLQRTA